MRRKALATAILIAASILAIASWKAAPVHGASAHSASPAPWNPNTAADYLDQRQVWWQEWPRAQKDHETLCISCHTQLPYALARPALRRHDHQTTLAGPESIMVASIEKRVSQWSVMVPFYSDAISGPGKTAQSHSTEAVLNAVILASYDARQPHLRAVTRTAFDEAWALQQTSGDQAGSWLWQDFHLGPWEATESAYQGAALLLLEASSAPDHYASQPAVREHIRLLRSYLQRNYATQPVMSQVYILWASGKAAHLLAKSDRATLIHTLQTLQQPDGGWRLSAMDKTLRQDDSPEPQQSDGLATALTVLAMEDSGTTRNDPTLRRGIAWLEQHQQPAGDWRATSLNKERDPETNVGRFMSDAATGYAVLALDHSR
jgi:hypothetical protein